MLTVIRENNQFIFQKLAVSVAVLLREASPLQSQAMFAIVSISTTAALLISLQSQEEFDTREFLRYYKL